MELLKKLTETYSPSGNEGKIRSVIMEEIKDYADEITTDNMGNLIAHKKGSGKKILLAAHMDEIGLLVNYIDEKGFLRFTPVGGVMPGCALYRTVVFENGVEGTVAYEEKEDVKKGIPFDKMYIDIGAQSTEEAQKMVSIGDSAVFKGDLRSNGDFVTSEALDNRIGVYVLIEVIKKLKKTKNDLYFAFTSQEEIGLRGAKVAANSISPDVGIAVDVTDTGDTPNCNLMAVKLGQGPCIKFMDNSIITHKEVNDILKKSAENTNTQVQYEVLRYGGTDAGAIHTSGFGVKTGAVSIPTRYIHTPCETINMKDVSGAIDIICDFVMQ